MVLPGPRVDARKTLPCVHFIDVRHLGMLCVATSLLALAPHLPATALSSATGARRRRPGLRRERPKAHRPFAQYVGASPSDLGQIFGADRHADLLVYAESY